MHFAVLDECIHLKYISFSLCIFSSISSPSPRVTGERSSEGGSLSSSHFAFQVKYYGNQKSQWIVTLLRMMLSDDACAGDAVADDGADVDAGDQPPALLSTSPSSWKSRLLEISTLSCPRTPSIARCKDHKINKTHKKLTRSSWLNCALGMYLFTNPEVFSDIVKIGWGLPTLFLQCPKKLQD